MAETKFSSMDHSTDYMYLTPRIVVGMRKALAVFVKSRQELLILSRTGVGFMHLVLYNRQFQTWSSTTRKFNMVIYNRHVQHHHLQQTSSTWSST